jgi:trafficking protein particle complex subunit 10
MLLVTLQILAAVRLCILAIPDSSDQLPPLYAGQPIPVSLSIQTSFHWDENRDASRQSYQMRFEIQEMAQDWLISGQTCGDFEAEVCSYPRG